MKGRRILLGSLIGIMMLALAACNLEPGRESTGNDTGSANTGSGNDETDGDHQGEDPTQGDADEGDAKGSEDESLEGLGGGYIWRREGGIAGFCDVVTVLAGTATVASCVADPPEIVGEVTLTAEQSRRMMTWLEELRTFDHTETDPATADAMTITLIFSGEGDNEPTEEVIAGLEALALEVMEAAR